MIVSALLAPAGARAAPSTFDGAGGPVVIELFTSQGCSSCPPAERVLSEIAASPRFGERVIPLAFHVDYWNHDGWRDRFSSARWSRRQESYDRVLRSREVYTPQMVIDGETQCVGSDLASVLRDIEDAPAAAGTVEIRVAPLDRGDAVLRVHLDAILSRALARRQKVMVVVYESGLVTPVLGGENSGATLRSDFVVRSLSSAFTLGPAAGSHRSGDLTVPLDPSWESGRLGVAAFIQDPATMRINGAGAAAVVPDADRAEREEEFLRWLIPRG